MDRQEIEKEIFEILRDKFEIENPLPDDNLREKYNFDSIDAIDLLAAIETLLDSRLSDEEKRRAMEIRTIRQILDYVEELVKARS